jgi:transposase
LGYILKSTLYNDDTFDILCLRIERGTVVVKKYIVRLTNEEQKHLKDVTAKGKAAAYKIRHANILLAVDVNGQNRNDDAAALMFGCRRQTVENVRRRLIENGLEAALGRKHREKPGRAYKLDGEKEAQLIAISCSEPPQGRSRWTLEMLSDRLVALKVVDSIAPETVRQTLKKTR